MSYQVSQLKEDFEGLIESYYALLRENKKLKSTIRDLEDQLYNDVEDFETN